LQKQKEKEKYFSSPSQGVSLPHSTLRLGEIFRAFGAAYCADHKLTRQQHRVLFDLTHCRTGYFGYHLDICDQCGYRDLAHNSCRNRHCPSCQGINRRLWVNARLSDLLPIPYYHAIFTLPHVINPLVPFNRELLYELLFDSAAETLLQLGRDPRRLGARIGFYGILHTWGGKLWHHLHLHLIVTGGGITADGQWIKPRYKGKFLFPVKVVSQVFRGKFVQRLKAAYRKYQLILPDGLGHLKDPARFEAWIDALVGRDWNVHVKRPFAGPQQVVRYIGRYSHKVAISNQRLIKIEQGRVHFTFKNHRRGSRWESTSLKIDEFIRRFLLHVLPKGFHRIRHFGFLANGCCKPIVACIRALLTGSPAPEQTLERDLEAGLPCPQCGQGRLHPIMIVHRFGVIFKGLWSVPAVSLDTS
jgi:hypothetical protein